MVYQSSLVYLCIKSGNYLLGLCIGTILLVLLYSFHYYKGSISFEKYLFSYLLLTFGLSVLNSFIFGASRPIRRFIMG
ncbi:hypothetical protein VNO77_25291 [Canavalia gladiata]|uniref:Uncharacterized protein n=1 Tax=Canavalia gladiata TaxID=3824 RepID=A0AAN9LBA3_CANGL